MPGQGPGAGHNGPVRAEQIAPTFTVGTRVMAAIILVATIALAMSGTIVWLLGQGSLRAEVDEQLERNRNRFRVLATQGVDPSTGAPFSNASQVVYAHIQRAVIHPGESELGFVGREVKWRPAENTTLRPDQDAQLVEALEPYVVDDESVITTLETAKGSYRVMVVPLRDGNTQAALVHIIDLDAAGQELRRTMLLYAASAVFTIALVSALSWFGVERLLRPIGELRRATESIGDNDLTSRVPVRGRDDLSVLAQTINWMLDRVQRSVEAERSLLDDIGHELRTPITIIRGHLELLDPGDAEDVTQTQTLAIEELDRMGILVNDLLLLAKSTGADLIIPEEVDVEDLTLGVFDKAQALGDRRWELEETATATCRVDRLRLTQAWLQLAANAVKYSDPGTRIAMGSRIDNGELLLWVTDEGIGIAEKDLDLVRTRFGRSADAERKAHGTGLGLSIVESIIGAHQGALDIASQPSAGSTFTLRMPCGGLGR